MPGCQSILTLLLLLSGSITALSSEITYTSQYVPEVLPTETEGTQVDPIWYFQTHEGAISYVTEGVLSGSTMECVSGVDRLQFWQIGFDEDAEYGDPTEAWAKSSQSEVTVDFSIRVNTSQSDDRANSGVPGGFEILVAFNGQAINLYFDTKGITVWGSRIVEDDLHLNTSFSTYRLVIQGGLASLFESGKEEPIFYDLEMRKGRETYSVINFGTGTTTTAGSWDLAFLGWKNDVAQFFSPPELNLPHTKP